MGKLEPLPCPSRLTPSKLLRSRPGRWFFVPSGSRSVALLGRSAGPVGRPRRVSRASRRRAARTGRYRLLELHDEDYVLEAVLRLDLDSEQLIPIDFVPPLGLEHFDCYGRQFGVDTQGRILSPLRDAGSAQIHTWDPLADTWGTLGEAVTGVQSLVAAPGSWGSLHAIRTEGWDYPYCEQDANWSDPPAGALAGTRIQLARSDTPVEVALYVPDHEFATDVDVDVEATAGCVAFWSAGLGETRIHDLDDGEALALDERLVWLSE